MKCTSKILYVRASLQDLAKPIKNARGIVAYLKNQIDFEDIICPYFRRSRPFWRQKSTEYITDSGALGKRIKSLPNVFMSNHPTHRFVGLGNKVKQVLQEHDENSSCFMPIERLTQQHDMSMLLLGCLDESPGFSTVHVAQYKLGITRRRLIKYLLRWDYENHQRRSSKIALEVPGCSRVFDKFYPHYENAGNIITGEWDGVSWIFIPSARKALKIEYDILKHDAGFGNCHRIGCPSCRLTI